MSLPDLLTVEDVMARYGLTTSRAACARMRLIGLVPGQPSNRPLVRADDLERFEREGAAANAAAERRRRAPRRRAVRVPRASSETPDPVGDLGPGWWRA